MYGMTSKILTHEYIYIYIYIKNSLVTQLLTYIWLAATGVIISCRKRKIHDKNKTNTGCN